MSYPSRRTFALLACLLAVGTALADESEQEKLARLVKGLKADKVAQRRRAASELAGLGPDAGPAIPALVEAMRKDADARVRAYAVFALRKMGQTAEKQVPVVLGVLESDKDEEVRCVAADFLGQHRAKAAVPALAAALKDREVGPHAAAALGKVGKNARSAVPALLEALQEAAVRSHAAAALGAIGTASLPGLTKALADANEDVRVEAVLALGIVGKPAVAGLVKALADKESDVRLNAVAAIGKIGDEAAAAVKPLLGVLEKDASPDVRIQAAQVLPKLGPVAADTVKALETAAKDKNDKVREAAREALDEVKRKGKE